MPPLLRWLIAIALVGAVVFWVLSRPDPIAAEALEGLSGDPARGEQVFIAAGCASCHVAPGEQPEGPPVLAGGQRFASDFGTFVAPNISSDQTVGVGSWTDLELVNAVQRGVSPEGAHYYPVLPYPSYVKAETSDIVDLIAYMRTLPGSETENPLNEVDFPFNIRRTLGVWKRLFVSQDWTLGGPLSPEVARGRYLVEALVHCGTCHTPRNALGGSDTERWLGGAPSPEGEGRVPNITPGGLDWSADEIAVFLSSGFTPEYDTAGGLMVAVIAKTSKLPPEDRAAIGAYLKAVPAVP